MDIKLAAHRLGVSHAGPAPTRFNKGRKVPIRHMTPWQRKFDSPDLSKIEIPLAVILVTHPKTFNWVHSFLFTIVFIIGYSLLVQSEHLDIVINRLKLI